MVFVIDKEKKPLAPCHEARARKLLKDKKASVYRRIPFTIILHYEVKEEVKPMTLKIDPGSRHTGIAILDEDTVVWFGQIEHKTTIQEDMIKRAGYRKRRRGKLRYRPARFNNRKKPEGWFPPTVMSRLQNIVTITLRLMKLCPIGSIQYELVKFDTQLMTNPDIKSKEYQEGPLYNTEMRAFLLDTFKGVCQYCHGASNDTKKEWEHKVPKSRGGSNSLSNATLACRCCNNAKDNKTPAEWKKILLSKKPFSALDAARVEGIKEVEKHSYSKALADAAITNSIRKKIGEVLASATDLPVISSYARNTKRNRVSQSLPKEHCVDAACVGREIPYLKFKTRQCMVIEANGRGKHCRTNVNGSGFPVSYLPRRKQFFGFQTGMMVKAVVPKGKKKGVYFGRVACRSSGSFDIKTLNGRIQGINYKYMIPLTMNDGYSYGYKEVL